MPSKIPPIVLENADIGFRNFSGKEGRFNPPGKRTFALFITPEQAVEFEQFGWNVKYLKPRQEDPDATPQAYLQVEARFANKPPVVALITSRGRTTLDEASIMLLDFADIKNVDLVINPFEWSVNEKSGVKAYLKSIYVTIHEDALELKYQDVLEVPTSARAAIEAPSSYDDDSVIAVY